MVDMKKEQELRPSASEAEIRPEELPSKPDENLEVEGWMERIEKKFSKVPSKSDDSVGDTVIVQQPNPGQPPVTLPVTQTQMQIGKSAKPDKGIAWLVVWAIRQLKLLMRMGKTAQLQNSSEVK